MPATDNDERAAAKRPWHNVLQQVADDAQWIAAPERAGSIPRVLPPAESAAFAGRQFEVYRRLGRQLQIQLR